MLTILYKNQYGKIMKDNDPEWDQGYVRPDIDELDAVGDFTNLSEDEFLCVKKAIIQDGGVGRADLFKILSPYYTMDEIIKNFVYLFRTETITIRVKNRDVNRFLEHIYSIGGTAKLIDKV